MSDEFTLVAVENPEEAAWGIIGGGVASYNKGKAGDNQFQRLCFTLQDTDQEIVGGILAELYWGWLFIDLLWVQEALRGRGLGGKLLVALEEEAKQQGATRAYLDTFSFQAPEFYAKHGYQVFGELADFPPGHQRLFMTKQL